MGKKCSLKTVALVVDEKEKAIESSRGRAQSWWRPSLVWEARVECRWHGKVAWKKIHNIKNEQQQNKNLLEVLSSKYHRWDFLAFENYNKNDYYDYFVIILWLFVIICYYKMIITIIFIIIY